jgi:hypothetical protein
LFFSVREWRAYVSGISLRVAASVGGVGYPAVRPAAVAGRAIAEFFTLTAKKRVCRPVVVVLSFYVGLSVRWFL